MSPMEAFRCAIAEIGYASSAELAAHMQKKHGVKIDPAFIPVFKATLQDLEWVKKVRQGAKALPPTQPEPSQPARQRREPITSASTCPPRPPAGKSRPCDRTRDRCRR